MNTKFIVVSIILILSSFCLSAQKKGNSDYLVLASKQVESSNDWKQVVDMLAEKHGADIFYYEKHPTELLNTLQSKKPRYVGVVDVPENLNRDFIVQMNILTRQVNPDNIYADFLWGIITGYNADAAKKMLNNSTQPLLIKDCVATIMELNSAKWFDKYAWVDDHQRGLWGEKTDKNQTVKTDNIDPKEVLKKFTDLYAKYDPDLVVTAAHATERNLEMPFSLGNLKPKDGKLFAESIFNPEDKWDLVESGKRKVYFAVGNCLIGNVNNTKESMAIAWMNGSNAATMVGYVVETWYGRNGWGGLKYWLTTPGKYTLNEAIYMNQQDMLYQLNKINPKLLSEHFPHGNFGEAMGKGGQKLNDILGQQPTTDQMGFWFDMNVLAYYGDPKWNVRLQEIPDENDYTVKTDVKNNKCIITIKTKKNFNLDRMVGDKFKEEHVLDIPFSYFFPERLNSPRLASGQEWEVALSENFILIYNADFKPNQTYKVILDLN